MRLFRLPILLTGCAVLTLTAPAAAQDAPIIVDPPVIPATGQQPVIVPLPGGNAIDPNELRPPLIVPRRPDPPSSEDIDRLEEQPGVDMTPPPPPPIPAVWTPVPVDLSGQSAYGLYLAGRLAGFRGDEVTAARLLAESQALTPEQPSLGEEAFRAGLFSGDLDTVVRLTPLMAQTPVLAEAGRLIEMVRIFGAGDVGTSLAMIKSRPFIDPYGAVVRYLTPAIAAAAGDWDTALAPVAGPPTDAANLILRQQRAQQFESRRRHAEADAEYQMLMAAPGGARLFAIDYAEFLERRDRREEAQAIYDAFLAGPFPDSRAVFGRARILGRAAPPSMPTPRENAAAALRFAALETSQSDLHPLSAVYLRLAEQLRPDDATALQLGESLAAAKQNLLARAAFLRVGRADPLIYARAQVYLAQGLREDGQGDAALEALQRADAAVPDRPAFALILVQQLNNMDRHEEALAVLARPSLTMSAQPADVRFERGRAFEKLGRLDEAEAELWAALQAQPNEPTLLNYLGYLWVDSGRRVDQGAEMLARAHAADPQNGNIQDSLGWAQFRQGRYETAVETLEQAVGKQPANAEINDHLGDAYWQVGRRREATWQWNRVLTLETDARRRAEVERKLVTGLPEPSPVTGQP